MAKILGNDIVTTEEMSSIREDIDKHISLQAARAERTTAFSFADIDRQLYVQKILVAVALLMGAASLVLQFLH